MTRQQEGLPAHQASANTVNSQHVICFALSFHTTLAAGVGLQDEASEARTIERGELAQLQTLVLIPRLIRRHQQVMDHLRRRVHLRAKQTVVYTAQDFGQQLKHTFAM